MDRFVLDFWCRASDMQKTYIIAKGIPYQYCIDKLGIIEDMIDSGEISQKVADKIESILNARGINNANMS